MSVEVRTDGTGEVLPVGTTASGAAPAVGRPNVSGDLPTVLAAAPMFGRAVAGYDRFQVDTYVQWAEQELAAADRERERLEERHLRLRAELYQARERLARTPGAVQLVDVSQSIGALLAAAADEAEGIRAEAAAERIAAAADAEALGAGARAATARAEAEAGRLLVRAVTDAGAMAAAARRLVADAEETARAVRAEAQARLEEARLVEQRAAEHAARLERDAREELAAARLQAREEVRAVLVTGREERRRADDLAASTRERLDREAGARLRAVLADVADLQAQRSALLAELDALTDAVTAARTDAAPGAQAAPSSRRARLRRLVERRPTAELLGSP